jgi:hypothetical protein
MATLLTKPIYSEICDKIAYLVGVFRDEQKALDPTADFDIFKGRTISTQWNSDKPSINIYLNALNSTNVRSVKYSMYEGVFHIDCIAPGIEGSTAPGYVLGTSDENSNSKLVYLSYQVFTPLMALYNHKFGFGNKIGKKNYPSWQYFQIENQDNATVITGARWTFDVNFPEVPQDVEHITALETIFISSDYYQAEINYTP